MRIPSIPVPFCVLAATLALPACAGTPDSVEDTSSQEDSIYGGFPAKSAKLRAVGAIVEMTTDKDGGVFALKCSGTLVDPHTVVTAAHCVEKYKGKKSLDYTELAFRFGFDSAAPDFEVPIVGGYVGPIYTGAITGRGADVGLFFLAEDVSDVTPIPLATTPLEQSDLGKTFAVVGYGQTKPSDAVGALQDRQMGTVKLAALAGDPKKVLWSTPEDLSKWLYANADIDIPASALGGFWNAPQHVLLEGQQAFFSSLHNGGQVGRGDSGGPILRLNAVPALEVVGISSANWAINLVNGLQVHFGGVYAGLPASADSAGFIQQSAAEWCRGVPESGYCNGDVALQCNPEGEFVQPITALDCRDFGMWCGVDEDGIAGCIDPAAPAGTETTCSLVGKYRDPANTLYEFKDDGTYNIRDLPRGHYTFEGGVLEVSDDIGACQGSSNGVHTLTFAEDCASFTFHHTHDGCRLRGESWDLTTLKRQ